MHTETGEQMIARAIKIRTAQGLSVETRGRAGTFVRHCTDIADRDAFIARRQSRGDVVVILTDEQAAPSKAEQLADAQAQLAQIDQRIASTLKDREQAKRYSASTRRIVEQTLGGLYEMQHAVRAGIASLSPKPRAKKAAAPKFTPEQPVTLHFDDGDVDAVIVRNTDATCSPLTDMWLVRMVVEGGFGRAFGFSGKHITAREV